MPQFDPYHKWLGIPPDEQPPDFYRLLGVRRFESDPEVIEAAADQRMAFLQRVAIGSHTAESQKLLNEVAAARVCLLSADAKENYDERLRSETTPAAAIMSPGNRDISATASAASKRQTETGVLVPSFSFKWRPFRRSIAAPLAFVAFAAVLGFAIWLIHWSGSADTQPRHQPASGATVRIEIAESLLADDAADLSIGDETIKVSRKVEEVNIEPGDYEWKLTRGGKVLAGPQQFTVRPDGPNVLQINAKEPPLLADHDMPKEQKADNQPPIVAPRPSRDAPVKPEADDQPPSVRIVSVEPQTPLAGGSVTVEVAGSDPQGDPLRFEYRRSGESEWLPATDDRVMIKSLPEGVLNLEFRAVDERGLTSAALSHDVTVAGLPNFRELRTLRGHTGPVYSVTISSDGQLLASGGLDQTVKLWDAVEGRLLRTLIGHAGAVRCVAFSPDCERIVSGGADKTLRIWDAATGRELSALKGHVNTVTDLTFSDDGNRIASGGVDWTIRLWNAATGRELQTFRQAAGGTSLAFSPDGRRIASRSHGNIVKLWDSVTGRRLRMLRGHTGDVSTVAFSADGNYIVSAGRDSTARLWDAITGRELRTLKGHTDWVSSVAVSPDGLWIATASRDKTVKLWEAATGRELQSLKGHIGWVYSVAVSSDGELLASAGHYRRVKIWRAVAGGKVPECR